jgi:hypothetical protein
MMETISSSETSVLKRATWGHIPEDGILELTSVFIRGLAEYVAPQLCI